MNTITVEEFKKLRTRSKRKVHENRFDECWGEVSDLLPVKNFKPWPDTGVEFDRAWPQQKLLIEIQGGQYMAKSGHTNYRGYQRDVNKHNRAVLDGYTVLWFTGEDVQKRMSSVIETICKVLNRS